MLEAENGEGFSRDEINELMPYGRVDSYLSSGEEDFSEDKDTKNKEDATSDTHKSAGTNLTVDTLHKLAEALENLQAAVVPKTDDVEAVEAVEVPDTFDVAQ